MQVEKVGDSDVRVALGQFGHDGHGCGKGRVGQEVQLTGGGQVGQAGASGHGSGVAEGISVRQPGGGMWYGC